MLEVNLGKIILSPDEYHWLKVQAALTRKPLRTVIADAWRSQLDSNRHRYIAQVNYLARRHGLTFEECFRRLVNGLSLGDVVNEIPVRLDEEKEPPKKREKE